MDSLLLILSARGPKRFELFEITSDEKEAARIARAIGGVSVRVPVELISDFRPQEER